MVEWDVRWIRKWASCVHGVDVVRNGGNKDTRKVV